MDNSRRIGVAVLAVFVMAGIAVLPCQAGENGWSESSTGWWGDFPGRKAAFSDNGMSAELDMAPGTGIAFERMGAWPASTGASLRMAADNVNATGNDYVPSGVVFPVSVTFVFGEDSLELGAGARVKLFFRRLWSGFPPSGIRLTYAWGNRVPTGSMYRLEEEETVFVIAGSEEAGKEVSATRRLADDFLAAYGRAPKGKVTRVVVRAQRPSGEKSPLGVRVSLGIPGN